VIPALPTVRRAALATVLAGSLVLSGCSSDGGDGGSTTTEAPMAVDVGAVLQQLGDDVIVPSYEALGASLSTLDEATTALCAAPSDDALVSAREAWLGAVTAYQGTRPAGVGPALDTRMMSDVAFAARGGVISNLLESGEPVDEGAVADEGSAARGLYAVEIALFGEGADALAGAAGARRCEYAASVASLAAQAAAPVIEEWTSGDAVDQLVVGLEGAPQSSVDALVNEAAHRADELDAMTFRDLAAAGSARDLEDTRLGGPADQRLADRKALLAGISALVGDGTAGISALVGAQDAGTSQRLVAAQATADEAVGALPDSVADAFDDPDAIAAASEAVAELKVLLSTEVASKLGVTINFSDSDGDG
jgi:predicted lipoprotein